MALREITDFQERGFEGFVRVSDLIGSNCCEIPEVPGVYCVLRLNATPPKFLEKSIGGHFKGKDPTVAIHLLKHKWISDAVVLNVGKAGGNGDSSLKSRIKQYMLFGQGKRVGHRGGRYIWQLHDSQDLILCWKPTPGLIPRDVEKALIRNFEETYQGLPFANLRH
ncbi:MAG: hypothetical protein WBQ94_29805 [Terracidiphilus sp.]